MKQGWEVKKIKDIATLITDGDWIESRHQSEEGIRLIQTGNIGEGYFKAKDDKPHYITHQTFKVLGCTEIFPGDCIVSRLPDPVGRACIIPEIYCRMITAVDCTIIRFEQKVIPQFFIYYSLSDSYENEINKNTTGTTRKRISRKKLEQIPIPVPPLPVQEQIVSELDLLSGIIEKKREQLKELDVLAQSIFYDMFGDPITNEKGWEVKKLKNITSKIGSGATPKGGNESYKTEGISLIRSLNVHNNSFVYKDLAYIDDNQAETLKNVTIEENDVLLNITGASVARCCVVPSNVLPARVNQHVAIIRAREILNNTFLCYLLTSHSYQQELISIGKCNGATREAITKGQLENLDIPIPPLPLQRQFASKIEAIERQKELIKQSITETETLFNERMQHYFG